MYLLSCFKISKRFSSTLGTISSKATLTTYHQQTTSHDRERLVKEEVTVQFKSKLTNGTVNEIIDMKCIAKWPRGKLRGIKIIHAFLLLLLVHI